MMTPGAAQDVQTVPGKSVPSVPTLIEVDVGTVPFVSHQPGRTSTTFALAPPMLEICHGPVSFAVIAQLPSVPPWRSTTSPTTLVTPSWAPIAALLPKVSVFVPD